MAKFQFGVTLNLAEALTARVADGTGAANQLDKVDNGKFVKLAGDSQFGLCAVGDRIGGVLQVANDVAPADGFNLGSVQKARRTRVKATADGSQAAGTGSLAVGDYVVAGTPVARGTSLSGAYPKVRKATNQPGSVPADLTAAGDQAANAIFAWRVVAILSGTGAVGDTVLIERE